MPEQSNELFALDAAEAAAKAIAEASAYAHGKKAYAAAESKASAVAFGKWATAYAEATATAKAVAEGKKSKAEATASAEAAAAAWGKYGMHSCPLHVFTWIDSSLYVYA